MGYYLISVCVCVFSGSTKEFRPSVKDYKHHNSPQGLVSTPLTINKRPHRDSAIEAGWGTCTVCLTQKIHISRPIFSLLGGGGEASPVHFNPSLPCTLRGESLLSPRPKENLRAAHCAKCTLAALGRYTLMRADCTHAVVHRQGQCAPRKQAQRNTKRRHQTHSRSTRQSLSCLATASQLGSAAPLKNLPSRHLQTSVL